MKFLIEWKVIRKKVKYEICDFCFFDSVKSSTFGPRPGPCSMFTVRVEEGRPEMRLYRGKPGRQKFDSTN